MRKATLLDVLARASPGLRFNEHLDEEDGPLVMMSRFLFFSALWTLSLDWLLLDSSPSAKVVSITLTALALPVAMSWQFTDQLAGGTPGRKDYVGRGLDDFRRPLSKLIIRNLGTSKPPGMTLRFWPSMKPSKRSSSKNASMCRASRPLPVKMARR